MGLKLHLSSCRAISILLFFFCNNEIKNPDKSHKEVTCRHTWCRVSPRNMGIFPLFSVNLFIFVVARPHNSITGFTHTDTDICFSGSRKCKECILQSATQMDRTGNYQMREKFFLIFRKLTARLFY